MPAADDCNARPTLTAIILAGGRASRLGGLDKGLLPLAGRPLIGWVMERLRPQVDSIVISANRNLDRYAALGAPVVPDHHPYQPGPLAGILAGARLTTAEWLLVAPCDTPLLPANLASGLLARAESQSVSLVRAADRHQIHYAVMLFKRQLLPDLEDHLARGNRQVQAWQARHPHAEAVFTEPNAFLNLNTAEDFVLAETAVAKFDKTA